MQQGGCSSAGRAPALQAGGQRFDPVQLHQLFEGNVWDLLKHQYPRGTTVRRILMLEHELERAPVARCDKEIS